MNEWQTLTLADVCTVITDGAHQSPKTVSRGKPMASVKDLTRFGVDLTSARHIATEDFEALVKQGCKPHVGDVLIAKDGNSALDTVCMVDHPLDAVLLSSVAILRPDPKCLDSVFLKFYLSSPETIDYLKSNFISGAAIPRVVLRDFKRAEIRLPSLDVQRRIARVLQSIDSKIDLNRRINRTLEAMAQAIFKSWFVDFDPVKAKVAAKQEGRDPLRAAMSAISGKPDTELDALPPEQYKQLAATAALFPDEMEESESGEIPRGWRAKKFGDFIDRISVGKKFDQKTALVEGLVPILDQGKSGIIGFHNELPGVRASLEKPVVVFANHTCYMRLITFDFSAIQNVLPFIGKGVDTIWAYYATKDRVRFSEYKGHWPDFVLADAVIPQSDLTAHFRKVLHPLISQMRMLELESENLATFRDTLLPKLLSGELSVTDVTREVST
ncbi:MAG: restriction endonuclease subunit S [Burkholderiales bacterium]|nr:restriction endonuclease subunit S [Burkholderiales bacterium]